MASSEPQFNGLQSDYYKYSTRCIQFLRGLFEGPMGILPAFYSPSLITAMYTSRGLAVPIFVAPPNASIDPDIPSSPSAVQMSIYNAGIAANAKVRATRLAYEAALVQGRAFIRAGCGPIPLLLVDREVDPLVTDDYTHFNVLERNYAVGITESIETQLLSISRPFDGTTTLAARISEDEEIHEEFRRQTGEVVADKLKFFALRSAAQGKEYLMEVSNKYSEDEPTLRMQSYVGLKTRMLAASTRHEVSHPPAPLPLFGGAAVATGNVTLPSTTFQRDGAAGTWTRQEILKFAVAPNPGTWTHYCTTCGTHSHHDSAHHDRKRNGPKSPVHDDTVLAAGSIGKQTPFISDRTLEARALKKKHNIKG